MKNVDPLKPRRCSVTVAVVAVAAAGSGTGRPEEMRSWRCGGGGQQKGVRGSRVGFDVTGAGERRGEQEVCVAWTGFVWRVARSPRCRSVVLAGSGCWLAALVPLCLSSWLAVRRSDEPDQLD